MTQVSLPTDLLGYIFDFMDMGGQDLAEMSCVEKFAQHYLTKRREEFKLAHEYYLKKVKTRYIPHKDIPRKFWTKELTLAYLEKRSKWVDVNIIPAKFRTPEFYLECVKRNGCSLYIIPEKDKTEEMCYEAVQSRGEALKFVPDRFKTFDICLTALQNNAYAFKYFLDELKTPETCFEAVRVYKTSIKYVPEEFWTDDLIKIAVQNDGNELAYINPKKRSYELCLQSLKSNGSIRNVPSNHYDRDIIELAFTYNPRSLVWVPMETLQLYGF